MAAFESQHFTSSLDIKTFRSYEATLNGMPATIESYSQAVSTAAENQTKFGQTLISGGLKAGLSTIGGAIAGIALNMAAMAVLSIVLKGISTVIDDIIHGEENAIKKGQEAHETIQNLKNEFNNKKRFVDDSDELRRTDTKTPLPKK